MIGRGVDCVESVRLCVQREPWYRHTINQSRTNRRRHMLTMTVIGSNSRFIADIYRAMPFSAKRGIAIACRLSLRLSVRPSVRLSVCDVGGL